MVFVDGAVVKSTRRMAVFDRVVYNSTNAAGCIHSKSDGYLKFRTLVGQEFIFPWEINSKSVIYLFFFKINLYFYAWW